MMYSASYSLKTAKKRRELPDRKLYPITCASFHTKPVPKRYFFPKVSGSLMEGGCYYVAYTIYNYSLAVEGKPAKSRNRKHSFDSGRQAQKKNPRLELRKSRDSFLFG